jgi:hypothetical protein
MPTVAGNPPGIRTPGFGPNGPGPVDARTAQRNLSPWQPPTPATATTIRYVRKSGSDSNGGTSPADAWLTIGKALTTVSHGTAIYIGAGTYRETVTLTVTPTLNAPVWVVGDVDGAFTGDAGMVQWTAFTTNDKTAPSATTLLNLNGKPAVQFRNILFTCGTANPTVIGGSSAGSWNCSFVDCTFMQLALSNSPCLIFQSTPSLPLNLLIDRCNFISRGQIINIDGARAPSDYDMNVVISNSTLQEHGSNGNTILISANGAGAGLPGGVRIRNCYLQPGAGIAVSVAANNSALFPCSVSGCLIQGATGLSANAAGQIVEDYNIINAGTPRTNVTAGVHSIADGSYAWLVHVGQELQWGGNLRPYLEPMAGSPLLGFGSADVLAGKSDGWTGPREQGPGQWAAGPLQRGNNLGDETGTVQAGSNAISVVGPGWQDFDVAVQSGQITFSIYCQRDSSYAGPAPQFQVLQNEQCGVGTNTVDFTPASIGAWEQKTLTFSPTSNGIVTVRVISSDTSGNSKTIFDTFAAS